MERGRIGRGGNRGLIAAVALEREDRDQAGEEAKEEEEAASGKITMTRTAISISDDKLDDSLFSLAGYTKKVQKFAE